MGPGESWPALCVCLCALGQPLRWSVPAAGTGLQPQGLICPGASNWGDWGPGEAAGQTAAVSEPSSWRHLHCTYLCVLYTYTYVYNISVHTCMSVYIGIYTYICNTHMSVYIGIHIHLCMCMHITYILTSGPPPCSAREGGEIMPLVLSAIA